MERQNENATPTLKETREAIAYKAFDVFSSGDYSNLSHSSMQAIIVIFENVVEHSTSEDQVFLAAGLRSNATSSFAGGDIYRFFKEGVYEDELGSVFSSFSWHLDLPIPTGTDIFRRVWFSGGYIVCLCSEQTTRQGSESKGGKGLSSLLL